MPIQSKQSLRRVLVGSCAAIAVAASSTSAFAQQTSDIVFLVDESGSMAGEQLFLETFVPTLDTNLMNDGVTARYGLVGFGAGGAQNQGEIYSVGSGQLGTAAQFTTSAQTNLDTSGGFEDGYGAIDVALNGYTFTPGSQVVLVLVTDEDRDIGDAALTFASVQAALAGTNGGATLVGILEANIEGSMGEAAIGTDGTSAFLVDGMGNVTSVPLGMVDDTGFDNATTKEDYIDLALQSPSGCVADLNQLRAGGASAQAFADVFRGCVATAATGNPPPRTTISHPTLSAARDLAVSLIRSQTLGIRMDGLDGGGAHRGAGYTPERGEVALDAYGIKGMRMFFNFVATEGDSDVNDENAATDFETLTVTAGIDRTIDLGEDGFLGSALYGAAIHISNGDTSLDNGTGNADARSYGGTLYGGLESNDGFYADARVSYTKLDMDISRIEGSERFSGDTDGNAISGGVRVGYDLKARLANPILNRSYTVGPYARLDYANINIDGFDEGRRGLDVGDIDMDRLDAEIGVRGQIAVEMNGASAFLKGRAGYRHDLMGDDESVGLNSGGTSARQEISASDESAIVVGLGFGAAVNQALTFAFEYDGQYGEDTTTHGISARVKIAF